MKPTISFVYLRIDNEVLEEDEVNHENVIAFIDRYRLREFLSTYIIQITAYQHQSLAV